MTYCVLGGGARYPSPRRHKPANAVQSKREPCQEDSVIHHKSSRFRADERRSEGLPKQPTKPTKQSAKPSGIVGGLVAPGLGKALKLLGAGLAARRFALRNLALSFGT